MHRVGRAAVTVCELLATLAMLALAIALLVPAPPTDGFFDFVHVDSSGQETPYVLFIPASYRGDKPFPLILFLHGHGDGLRFRVTEVGLGQVIARDKAKFPFFALFPRTDGRWYPDSPDPQRAIEVLEAVGRNYSIDRRRVYLTGVSSGGSATWQIAAMYPATFAAIVPVCGVPPVELVPRLKHIPCWCFHGDSDDWVRVDQPRRMIEALRAVGGDPRYTEFKGHAHGIWGLAYDMPELYEWLLEQRLP